MIDKSKVIEYVLEMGGRISLNEKKGYLTKGKQGIELPIEDMSRGAFDQLQSMAENFKYR